MMDDIFQEEITQGWLKIYMNNVITATKEDKTDYTCKVLHILEKL